MLFWSRWVKKDTLANVTSRFCNILLSIKYVLEGLTKSIHKFKRLNLCLKSRKSCCFLAPHLLLLLLILSRTSRHLHSTLTFNGIEYKEKLEVILFVLLNRSSFPFPPPHCRYPCQRSFFICLSCGNSEWFKHVCTSSLGLPLLVNPPSL